MFEKLEKMTVRRKILIRKCTLYIYEKSREISVHKNPGNSRGQENPRTRAQGDSVVLHSSRREDLHLLSFLNVHLRVYIYDGEAVSPSLQTYGGLCLGKGERCREADRRVARPGEAERAGVG